MNVRVACARVVAGVIQQEGSLNTLLPAVVDDVADKDVNLLQELCYGTLRHYPALAVIAEQLLERPLKKKDSDIQALILSGLYQIREMRTPPHAAVNEAVSACKTLKKPWARGLVNSTLRRYLRERETIDASCQADDRYTSLHPRWLQRCIADAWGERAAAVLAGNNQRAPMTLRSNHREVTRESYLEALAAAGIAARPAPLAAEGIYLAAPCNVSELPGFEQGWVSVQDEAAQLCADLLDLQPGQRVLDGCCAPGGKSCHILERQSSLAELVALDMEGERLALVAQNLRRLHLEATLVTADGRDPAQWWDGRRFDRILLDAPCSATGVIRRHPDIKLLRRPEDIAKLAATQAQLLDAFWSTLAPGGKLLYATCSILPEENDGVIEAFIQRQSDCRCLAIDVPWGSATSNGRQLLPAADSHDGFYYALLEKLPSDESGTGFSRTGSSLAGPSATGASPSNSRGGVYAMSRQRTPGAEPAGLSEIAIASIPPSSDQGIPGP